MSLNFLKRCVPEGKGRAGSGTAGRLGPLSAAVFAAVLVSGLLMPLKASAEPEGLTIKNMKVTVEPEYDDPRVLVIYEGEFVGDANFGKKVQFFVPKGAEINQVCALRKPADEHLCQLYDTDSTSQSLTFSLPIPTFYMEFYYQPLEGSLDKKMDYNFESFYPINKLSLDLQQPLRTTNFVATPKADKIGSDGKGFSYHQYQFDNVAPSQPVKLSASYTKTDAKPSVEKTKPGSGTGEMNLPLLAAFGAGILALAGVYAFSKRRPQPARVYYNRRPTPPSSPRAPAPNIAQRAVAQAPRQVRAAAKSRAGSSNIVGDVRAFFCTNCGTEVMIDENFCPSCGQKARKPV